MNLRYLLPSPITTQLFIHTNEIKTHYTIMNFPSLLSPKTAYPVKYTIKIYANKKKELLSKTYVLQPFQSKDISFEEEHLLPELGIVTIEMNPLSLFLPSDYHLRKLTPHFYTKFISENHDSIGLIHTQTRFGIKGHSLNWKSSLKIDPQGIRKIVAYQINPTNYRVSNNLSLHTHSGNQIINKSFEFKECSALSQEYSVNSLELLHFELDKTTTPNAKPLLFLYFEDNTFTTVHS